MKSVKNSIIIVSLLFTWASCVEDLGNYEYHDVNDIEIIIEPRTFTVALGASLKITPDLYFSVGEDNDSLAFEWHRVSGSYQTSARVISRERNLDIEVGPPTFPRMGTYSLLYCVYNKTTGVRYTSSVITVIVQDEMLRGYIMLCETKDNFDIELISTFNDTLKQYHNVLDLLHSEFPREGRTAWDLLCYPDPASPMLGQDGQKNYAVWILTDQGSERVRVENFEWAPNYDISGISMVLDKYLNGGKFIARKMHVQPYTVASFCNWVNDLQGNWYWYNWIYLTNFCVHPVNRTRGTDVPYKAAPYIFGNPGSCAILFNEDVNRFEVQSAYALGATEPLFYTSPLQGTQIFDWQNPNYRLMYMGNRVTRVGYAVVKNVQTSRYEFLQWITSDGNTTPTKDDRKDFPMDDAIPFDEFKFYAYHNQLPYLFCGTENRLYRIDVNSMSGWEDVTNQVLPEGHLFSKVKTASGFQRFSQNDIPDLLPVPEQIVICTYDPFGQKGQNGRLAMYDVTHGTGQLTLAKHPHDKPLLGGYQVDMEWTGFGKIINVDFKNP